MPANSGNHSNINCGYACERVAFKNRKPLMNLLIIIKNENKNIGID